MKASYESGVLRLAIPKKDAPKMPEKKVIQILKAKNKYHKPRRRLHEDNEVAPDSLANRRFMNEQKTGLPYTHVLRAFREKAN